MTIKRRWYLPIPCTDWRIPIVRTLKPGYRETLIQFRVSVDQRHQYNSPVELEVLDNDRATFDADNSLVGLTSGKYELRKNDINAYFEWSKLEFFTTDGLIFPRRVEIYWEPTLPPRARK